MLLIRSYQMAALSTSTRAEFDRRVIAYLRTTASELAQPYDDPGLHAIISEAIAIGFRSDMTAEQDVLWLVLFRLSLGSGFDRSPDYPWVGAILADPDMPAGVKALQIRIRLDAMTTPKQAAEPAHVG